MSTKLRGSILLLFAAFIWGSAFVAQSEAMADIGPFAFQTVRSFTAAPFIFLLALLKDAIQKKWGAYIPPTKEEKRKLLIGGLICGLALGVAANFQQYGISLSTDETGKAGFLTALYILFVPLLGLFLRRKPPVTVWISLPIAVAGLYLLCMKGSFSLSGADIALLLCSVMFAVQILCCDRFAPGMDCFRLSALQFVVNGAVSLVLMLLFERDGFAVIGQNLSEVWFPLLYCALLSSGLAYTFQLLGQRDVHPTVASLLMSLESVFAVLSALVVQGQKPTLSEWIGCALMFAAILLAQIPVKTEKELSR